MNSGHFTPFKMMCSSLNYTITSQLVAAPEFCFLFHYHWISGERGIDDTLGWNPTSFNKTCYQFLCLPPFCCAPFLLPPPATQPVEFFLIQGSELKLRQFLSFHRSLISSYSRSGIAFQISKCSSEWLSNWNTHYSSVYRCFLIYLIFAFCCSFYLV